MQVDLVGENSHHAAEDAGIGKGAGGVVRLPQVNTAPQARFVQVEDAGGVEGSLVYQAFQSLGASEMPA